MHTQKSKIKTFEVSNKNVWAQIPEKSDICQGDISCLFTFLARNYIVCQHVQFVITICQRLSTWALLCSDLNIVLLSEFKSILEQWNEYDLYAAKPKIRIQKLTVTIGIHFQRLIQLSLHYQKRQHQSHLALNIKYIMHLVTLLFYIVIVPFS